MNTDDYGGGCAPGAEPPPAVEAVRADSARGELTRASRLRERLGRDPLPEIEASDSRDIQLMEGIEETYLFSETRMTRPYAVFLFRMEEKDLVRLVVDAVREDSRVYPRPTPLEFFRGSPFNLSEENLADILKHARAREDCSDIRENRASNGARYLYSTLHLEPAYADGLTEWIEVGQAEYQ